MQLSVLGLRLAALGIWDGFQGGHGPALLLWVPDMWNVHSNARHRTRLWRYISFYDFRSATCTKSSCQHYPSLRRMQGAVLTYVSEPVRLYKLLTGQGPTVLSQLLHEPEGLCLKGKMHT